MSLTFWIWKTKPGPSSSKLMQKTQQKTGIITTLESEIFQNKNILLCVMKTTKKLIHQMRNLFTNDTVSYTYWFKVAVECGRLFLAHDISDWFFP